MPDTVEGTDRTDLITGKTTDGDEPALITCPSPFGEWTRQKGGREYRGIRTRRHTYVRTLDGPWLLYDNDDDPYQMNNLVGKPEYAALQAELETILDAPPQGNQRPVPTGRRIRRQMGLQNRRQRHRPLHTLGHDRYPPYTRHLPPCPGHDHHGRGPKRGEPPPHGDLPRPLPSRSARLGRPQPRRTACSLHRYGRRRTRHRRRQGTKDLRPSHRARIQPRRLANRLRRQTGRPMVRRRRPKGITRLSARRPAPLQRRRFQARPRGSARRRQANRRRQRPPQASPTTSSRPA